MIIICDCFVCVTIPANCMTYVLIGCHAHQNDLSPTISNDLLWVTVILQYLKGGGILTSICV